MSDDEEIVMVPIKVRFNPDGKCGAATWPRLSDIAAHRGNELRGNSALLLAKCHRRSNALNRVQKAAKHGIETAGECEDARSLFEAYRDDMKAILALVEEGLAGS